MGSALPPSAEHRSAPLIVVMGGSAGALDVMRRILRCLPAVLDLPVVIVLHLSARPPDGLPELLSRDCVLPVKQAEDKETLMPGTVYLAPPGYHLLIESHRALALSVDPPVHYSRPSIDVLFESTRDAYGAHVVALLLSGASIDGAAGLQEIHAAGGIAIVQDPDSAEAPVMPRAALSLFQPAHVWTPDDITRCLPALLSPPAGSRELKS